MPVTRVHQRHWVITLALAAGAILYVVAVFLPTQREISRLRDEVNHKQAALSQSTTLDESIRAVDDLRAAAARYTDETRSTLAAENALPEVLAQISETTSAAGARLVRFDPLPPVRYQRFQVVPVKLSCQGSFGQIFDMVRQMERMPFVVWVDEFRLESTGDAAASVRSEVSLLVFADFSDNSN